MPSDNFKVFETIRQTKSKFYKVFYFAEDRLTSQSTILLDDNILCV